MNKTIVSVLIAGLLATTVFTAGCSCFTSSLPYGPRVTGDDAGGAIAVYEDVQGGNRHDFYVQKINPEGELVWGEEGVLIGSGYKKSDSYRDMRIISDGSGGSLVFWYARPSEQQRETVSHITSVDAGGNIRWQREVEWADYIVSDGAGGAIITSDRDYVVQFFVIKLDSEGRFPWGEDGLKIRICNKYSANSLRLCGDDDGGAVIVWEERESEPGTEPNSPKITNYIYAQRVNAEGNLPWGQDGVLLYNSSEDAYADELQLTGDGSGGAIATWRQVPRGKIEDDSPRASLFDICAQRVDASGNTMWKENDIRLGITKNGGRHPINRAITGDGAGGAVAVWEDLRNGLTSVYAQRIDSRGDIRWRAGGEEVCYIERDSSFWPHMAVSDGTGNTIVSFGTLVQKIDAFGNMLWKSNGVQFANGKGVSIAGDGKGGIVVAWGESRTSYAQRINADGKPVWGSVGIRLRP